MAIKILTRTLIFSFLIFTTLLAVASSSLTLFHNEQEAQQHCPKDIVVWLNLQTGIYHLKGERWYGNTRYGAYVCKTEADQTGDRETRNWQ